MSTGASPLRSQDHHIGITDSTDSQVNHSLLPQAIQAALIHHGVHGFDIELTVVDDAQIAELNLAHLGHEGPTDVLTFDLRDSADSPRIEGQIVISIDTARREAAARGHSLEAELALYAVHGTLHLLGHDDHDEAAAAAMHRLEDELLISLGLGATFSRDRKSNEQA